MRTRTAWCGAVGAVALAGAAGAFTPGDAKPGPGGFEAVSTDRASEWKLRGDLAAVVRAAAPDQLIPISIVMRHQAEPAVIDDASRMANKAERRAAVVGALKAAAAATNGDVVALLQAEQALGNVGPRLRPLWIRNVVATSATPAVVRALAARDDVAWVNWDRPVGKEVFPIVPDAEHDLEPEAEMAMGGDIECGVDIMGAPEVWSQYDITGRDIVVGIIDTGCCVTHPDLANQIWINPGEVPNNGQDDDNNGYVDDVNGYNFWQNNNNVGDSGGGGHGTHTAGTVAGDGTNGTTTGMAPDAQMMILKFWNSFSGESVVWEATEYAIDNDADVITASIGWIYGVDPDRVTWRQSNENAMAAGIVVYAAGNEGGGSPPNNLRTPGDVPDMITAGATDCNSNIAGFSSRGPVTWQNIDPWNDWPYPPGKLKPTVSAPGVSTVSCDDTPCNGYSVKSGTSMATPHISGAVALMLEANPNLDHWDVKQMLKDTAVDRGPNGPDNDYGHGRVNALAAVEAALASATPGDIDGDGDVDFQDLLLLLEQWGECEDPCDADLDDDGDVDFNDLLLLIANWTG